MIGAALALVAWVQSAPPQGADAARASAQAVLIARAHEAEIQALLHRDPRSLTRSEPSAWKDFDPKRLTPESMPSEMTTVARAVVVGDMLAALSALYVLLDRVHEFPPALHMMGIAYFRMQRYGDSAVVLARYVELVPQRIGDTRVLGHDLYSLGRYAEARAHYERVVAASPGDAEAWRGLALAQWRLGEAEKALELLDKVIELDPKNDEAWTWKAQILFDAGRDEDALKAAERARDLDPHAPRTWFVLGQILGDLGRASESAAAAARFRELGAATAEVRALENKLLFAPRDADLLAQLVAVHERTGDVVRVREDLARLGAAQPDDVRARIRALDVLDRMGDLAGARAAARVLEERAGGDAAVWQRLAKFYARIGDAAGTTRALEKAKKADAR